MDTISSEQNHAMKEETSMDPNTVPDEVYPRQCPCRRAFELENVFGTWRTRRRSDESGGTRGFTQVQPPQKVKGLRPACLTCIDAAMVVKVLQWRRRLDLAKLEGL
jgi:hypothetical protein